MLQRALFAFRAFQFARKYSSFILALIAVYLLAVPMAVIALIVGLIASSLSLAVWTFIILELIVGVGVWAGRNFK